MRPEDLPWTFHSAKRPSVNFCQISVQPGELPSSFRKARGILLNSVYPPCGWETIRQLSSTFRAAGRLSINFCQHSVRPGHPSTSVNSPLGRETFCELPSIFHAAEHFSSTFINISYGRETFRRPSSTFHAAGRPSVKLCQLFLRLGKLH